MNKTFMLLYPNKEYIKILFNDDSNEVINKFNETINKRYREKGYNIIYVSFNDKEPFRINLLETDKIIYTDISYNEHINKDKKNRKYPNELQILKNVFTTDQLVLGGFHYQDLVKRVGEEAINLGINCYVDLELTDNFINIYNSSTFNIDEYDKEIFKERYLKAIRRYTQNETYSKQLFDNNFSSKAYGFNIKEKELKK